MLWRVDVKFPISIATDAGSPVTTEYMCKLLFDAELELIRSLGLVYIRVIYL